MGARRFERSCSELRLSVVLFVGCCKVRDNLILYKVPTAFPPFSLSTSPSSFESMKPWILSSFDEVADGMPLIHILSRGSIRVDFPSFSSYTTLEIDNDSQPTASWVEPPVLWTRVLAFPWIRPCRTCGVNPNEESSLAIRLISFFNYEYSSASCKRRMGW